MKLGNGTDLMFYFYFYELVSGKHRIGKSQYGRIVKISTQGSLILQYYHNGRIFS